MPCIGIFGIVNRFSEYESGTSQGESRIEQETMSISTLISKSLSEGLSKPNGDSPLRQWQICQHLYKTGAFNNSKLQVCPWGGHTKTIVLRKEAKMELDWWM